nr:MBL fold metallo-hydrolase [uncultured Selenomonas sp.]
MTSGGFLRAAASRAACACATESLFAPEGAAQPKSAARGLRVAVLASGSKGNAAYIELDGVRLLIDAGISARRITRSLADLGVDAASLDGVFVTHEHSDHIKGLPTLLKQYRLPLFAPPATLRAIGESLAVPEDTFTPLAGDVMLGSVAVKSFSTLHDAASPVGYAVCGSEKCALATDLGFLTNDVMAAIEGSDVLILEANHDRELLQSGSYPWRLKQRILSNRGHLSNSAAAWALVRLKKRPRAVFLAHMSQENNRPELVEETVRTILAQQNVRQENLLLTAQDVPTCFTLT